MYKAYAIRNLNNIMRFPAGDSVHCAGLRWEFGLIIDNVLRIVSDDPKRDIFVDINESLDNHDEILNAVLKILKETL